MIVKTSFGELRDGDIVVWRKKTGETGNGRLKKVDPDEGLIFDEPVCFDDEGGFDLDGPVRIFEAKMRECEVIGNLSNEEWQSYCATSAIDPSNPPDLYREQCEFFVELDRKIVEFFDNLPAMEKPKPN